MAVGYYDDSGGNETAFAAAWSGTTFVVEPPALPSGWPYSSLSGVSCRAANWCIAVGGASTQSYSTETLAERWDGANWTIESTPNPDQDPEVTILNYLNTVSCASLGQCEAVGGAGGTNQWLAEQRSQSTPVVSSISPQDGPTTGGTLVTVTGANLTGTTSVRFGRVAATSFTIQSPEEITAGAPAEPAGTVDITAATPNATSATSPADQFIFQGLRRNLRLSGVRLSHRRFRTSKASSTRAPVGTQLRFELSIAANLRIQVAQLRPGARRGRKCVPMHGKLERGRAQSCTRLVIIETVKRKRESHGWHRLSFSGEIRRHALAPGHYRMLIVASAPSQNTMRAQVPFSIVR
jgi:IPT/TIG domain